MGGSSKKSQVCPICLAPTLSTHFGVVSCRACAAFYRRAVVERKEFHCRQSQSCTYYTNIRHSCKKCRFDRCIQYGMKKEAIVQKEKLPLRSDLESQTSIPMFTPSPSSSSSLSTTPLLIKNLVEKYRLLCSVRKATEFALRPHRESSKDTGLEGLCFGTSGTMSLFFRAHLPSFIHFISDSYSEFSLLTDDEKWLLLQPFFAYFWWLDSAYRTYKTIKKEQFTKYGVMSETMYFDVDRVDEWVSDMNLSTHQTCQTVTEDVKHFVLKRYRRENQVVLHYLNCMKVTEEEFVCLIGLLFWNTAGPQKTTTENMTTVIDQARKSIYSSLEQLYSNLGSSWAIRYGELLNLINTFLIECLRCKEELGLLSSLDAFKKEDFFYEMEVCWEQKAKLPSSPLN